MLANRRRRKSPKGRRFAASERSETERLANLVRAWGPAAVWAAVLFLLSAWSSPVVPRWLWDWDKLAHAGLYSVLGATLGYGRHHAISAPPHWVLIGIGALYGATDEWHQAFVRGRSADVGDWVADVTGVTVGYVVLLAFLGWLARGKGRTGEKVVDVSD